MAGVPRLLDDLARLADDRDTCEVLFLASRDETPVHAHKLMLRARCASFQNVKRGELCKIPGSTVSPSPPGPSGTFSYVIRWPQVKGEVLKEVIHYVYCGKVILQEGNVFEVLAVAHEMGIDELKQSCEEHIVNTLSVHNACSYLSAALALDSRIPRESTFSFVARCTSFIGENAYQCLKTPAFLNLSKDAVIHIISSDYLALDEADVFRAVLSWAKHQTGVLQPTQHWTEEERARVSQQLSAVIKYVRIMLIDSQVFAEEVEPTGAVPIEMSLERYRLAALPAKFANQVENQRAQPRTSLTFFQSSQLLAGDKAQLQRLLNTWYGVPKQSWRLLYRASTHGFSADSFHAHCDGHAATFVVVLTASGELCGGFSDVPWSKATAARGRYASSDRAFLFTLVNKSEVAPTKFDIAKRMFAVNHHPDFGPVFGAGSDLSIASNCNQNVDSYSNFPHSYACHLDNNNGSGLLVSDYNFKVIDYEVFATIGGSIVHADQI